MSDSAATDYERLLDRARRLTNIKGAKGILRWDQEVMMPPGGTPARSKQLATLSALEHELLTEEEVGEWLASVETSDLDPTHRSVVRELERQYDRAVAVPTELIEEIAETTSEALPVWQRAREEDDFDQFAPILEQLVELRREYAEHIAPDRDPYVVLFEDYEPYLGLETAELILGRLREDLVPLIDQVGRSGVSTQRPFEGTFSADAQEAVARAALEELGYDWDRGRLDTAPHPFSTGTVYDARVTTRYDETEPMESLLSTIHEFGHATYTLGLPEEHFGTPLGSSRDMTVHESQSRFWENHIGRSRAFWDRFLPSVQSHFDQLESFSAAEAYAAVNRVYPDNLIRVDADELTYHLHIVLRFEIERDLIEGDLKVADIPQVWNDKMEQYLGVRPDTDADGCLQDIHWSHAAFGYFPTYSLGSVLAAQLEHHLAEDVGDFDGLIREGDFEPIHHWLTEHVHRHGSRFTTPELIREATGEPFTADYFLEYVNNKFGELYGV